MLSLPYAVALAAISALLGGAVAWGALNATVKVLTDAVKELRADVATLNVTVSELRSEVAVLRALDGARHDTGSHRAAKG